MALSPFFLRSKKRPRSESQSSSRSRSTSQENHDGVGCFPRARSKKKRSDAGRELTSLDVSTFNRARMHKPKIFDMLKSNSSTLLGNLMLLKTGRFESQSWKQRFCVLSLPKSSESPWPFAIYRSRRAYKSGKLPDFTLQLSQETCTVATLPCLGGAYTLQLRTRDLQTNKLVVTTLSAAAESDFKQWMRRLALMMRSMVVGMVSVQEIGTLRQ